MTLIVSLILNFSVLEFYLILPFSKDCFWFNVVFQLKNL